MKFNRCACILLLFFAGVVTGAKLPETAKFLPERTAILVNVEDLNECREQFKKTNLYGLYTDPSMKAFVTETERRLKEFLQSSEDETVRTIAAVDALPSGKVAFAFILPKEGSPAETEPKMLFIAQWGEKLEVVKDAVEKMVQKAIEDGSKRSRQDYRGVNITTIKSVRKPDVETDSSDSVSLGDSQENSGQAQGPANELSYCFIDDALIVAESVDSIEFVVAHIKGSEGGTLAEDNNYVSAMKAVGPYHDIDIYINVKKLIDGYITEDSSDPGQDLFKSLGLDNINGYSFSLGIARELGSNYLGKMALKVDGEKRGITKMLEFVSGACKEPKFIGTRACSVTFINLDLVKAYDELFRVLAQYQPRLAANLNSPLTPPTTDGKAGLTLKEGILNHLGSEITVSEVLDESPLSEEPLSTKVLVSVSVKDAEKLEETVSQLHGMFSGPGVADARREFMGHTIYLIKIPGLTSPPEQMIDDESEIKGGFMFAPDNVPAFTVTDTAFLIGGESSIERSIRLLNDPGSDTIGSVRWYRKARALVPQMAGVASFSDDAAQIEQLWKRFKRGFAQSDQADASLSAGMMTFDVDSPGLGEIGKVFDTSALPEFEKVRKYFGISAFYGISRPDGFYFEFRDANGTSSNAGQ
jgi:hypothetical protein